MMPINKETRSIQMGNISRIGAEAAKVIAVTLAPAIAAQPLIVATIVGGLLVASGVALGVVIVSGDKKSSGDAFDLNQSQA
jgi:hypothetical protein